MDEEKKEELADFVINNNNSEARGSANHLLITRLGFIKKADARMIKEKLVLQGSPIAGWIVL